jgi:hypothetical protein
MHLRYLVAVLAALACTSTLTQAGDAEPAVTTDGTPFDAGTPLRLDGGYFLVLMGFQQHEGRRTRLKLHEEPSPRRLVGEGDGTVMGGTAFIRVPVTLVAGTRYLTDVYVDTNNDGVCSPCGTSSGEHAWRRAVVAPFEVFTHNTSFTDINRP